ncbi:hypothetical protein CWO27_14580 [Vibrio sp. 10N.286.51.C3]|uniref:NACHT domain-containing protein n=1 Tax=unclassified Vibrio TaxID=2614977 RepID=UPI000D3C50E6|nr:MULTISPECIES: hypothetical protein [unclassified Vibrio]PTP13683.1 hypothetical protein CWO27_14580 [Vibrio sp. 10N.286.51.C3]TKE73854.1 hypothetical protein FCV45_01860 [Vibrio sp. F12]
MSKYIPLNRQFSPVSKDQKEAEKLEQSLNWGIGETESWDSLLCEYRCVVLAEAGAGKTIEFREKATLLANEGKPSFFIRIEDIDRQFYDAFEVGDEDTFDSWLASSEEAWFFLDSVDEARLTSPRAFEKAITRFSKGIRKGAHRAHIYISSRPYSWRPEADRNLMNTFLFFASPENKESNDCNSKEASSALRIYGLRPLDSDRISEYSNAHGIEDTEKLLNEVNRLSLWSLAERPFDLDVIITKWADDKSLGGRLNLLQHNVDTRLKESHNLDRPPLNVDKARDGAQRLAAAVVLTGNVGVNIPDSEHSKKGIDADTILYDWALEDVKTLLESGLFNDIIYGVVRFRHRDIRELLAAEFFDGLLKAGHNRSQIESYFFRESLGESIVTPLLRPLLPWLILFDENICTKTLKIKPEIAVEEGDPAQLPLDIRKRILVDIVNRIANSTDVPSAQDNSAIARIAQSDLTEDALNLITLYQSNDDVIFFLGRLVWQGGMTTCVESLIPIAVNSNRDKYARIASIRAVMTCGSEKQKHLMWKAINDSCSVLPRELLVELIDESAPTQTNIELFLESLPKLPKYKEFEFSRLSDFLFNFVERTDSKSAFVILDGIFGYLEKEPYIERRECRISEQYAWLVSVALKCIEKLVLMKDKNALSVTSLSILANAAALRYWRNENYDELKHDLNKLIPQWPELNDALFWHSIEKARQHLSDKERRLTDDLSISYLDHYWGFEASDFLRLLGYIESRFLVDDRLVALNTTYRIYQQCGYPVNMLTGLHSAVEGHDALIKQLNKLLNPVISSSMQEFEKKEATRSIEIKAKKMEQEQTRKNWIISLRKDPSRISSPIVDNGEITNNHARLMNELEKNRACTTRRHYTQWQLLIPDFGNEVALAYKDFCVKHWRNYRPKLRSEEKLGNSISGSLLLALAGLEIEAAEYADFPKYLSHDDLDTALRYLTWDINGFPSWFEKIHQAFPTDTQDAVLKEFIWEIGTPKHSESVNHILHDLVYYAPWLSEHIAPKVLDTLMRSSNLTQKCSEYCVRILIEGGIEPEKLTKLARKCMSESLGDNNGAAWWFALLVDSSPSVGIQEFESWLSGLDNDSATHAAEIFIVALLGGRSSQKALYCAGRFRTVAHLKSLYILMHKYIKTSDDIERAGKGVYSPTTRDRAQEARDMLFSYLVEIQGKESYWALKQLIEEHPEDSYRPWMRERAYKMAEAYGNISPWSAHQFKEFHRSKLISPESHRQLFELAVLQLNAIKDWVENGNDSPWMTWQRATEENEVRTLIAAELRKCGKGYYTIAEEPELANEQRMDIWLDSPNISSPVPIELKLLDKQWSGPKLCERLRNQLVGDYLREQSAGCGVFLLISQNATKKWVIDGKRIGTEGLASKLKDYWKTIASQYVGVEEIEVIVIDMKKRSFVCDT